MNLPAIVQEYIEDQGHPGALGLAAVLEAHRKLEAEEKTWR